MQFHETLLSSDNNQLSPFLFLQFLRFIIRAVARLNNVASLKENLN